MDREAQVHHGLMRALANALRDGESAASDDDLVWGDDLERIRDEAGADIHNARQYLDLLFDQVNRDPNHPLMNKILSGLSKSLANAIYRTGRFRANPMSRMAQETADVDIARRVVDGLLKNAAIVTTMESLPSPGDRVIGLSIPLFKYNYSDGVDRGYTIMDSVRVSFDSGAYVEAHVEGMSEQELMDLARYGRLEVDSQDGPNGRKSYVRIVFDALAPDHEFLSWKWTREG